MLTPCLITNSSAQPTLPHLSAGLPLTERYSQIKQFLNISAPSYLRVWKFRFLRSIINSICATVSYPTKRLLLWGARTPSSNHTCACIFPSRSRDTPSSAPSTSDDIGATRDPAVTRSPG